MEGLYCERLALNLKEERETNLDSLITEMENKLNCVERTKLKRLKNFDPQNIWKERRRD